MASDVDAKAMIRGEERAEPEGSEQNCCSFTSRGAS